MPKIRERDAGLRSDNPVGRDFSEALARGLAVMTVFGPDSRAMTLSAIAREVDLPKATVRRTLLTLIHLGYMEEEGRLFSLRPTILRLASSYLGADPVSTIFQPVCERLARELGVTCSVAVLDAEEAVMIAYASPRRVHAHGTMEGIGLRLPAFCTAVGRILLAGRSPAERAAFLAALDARAITPYTVTDKDRLRQLWVQAESDGYALVDQEAEIGFRSIAVPVRRRDGRLIAALNVGLRVEHANCQEMRDISLPRLLAEVADLKEQLL
ncbi:MAG: IclR family transcriptional regulator C-terminal domain-containing protein [Gluconacetobacter liquefaciens]